MSSDAHDIAARPSSRTAMRKRRTRFLSVIAVGALFTFPVMVLTAGSAAAAGPSITVTPSSGLLEGQSVTVSGTGYDGSFPVQKGLLHGWLTFFVPGVAGPEGCRDAQEVPCGVQA